MGTILKGKGYTGGVVEAEAVVSEKPFGFWQGIDTDTGIIKDARHDKCGESIKGKVFIYPYGRGSTANSGVFIEAVRNKVAPVALVNIKTEPMNIVSAILAEEFFGVKTPVLDGLVPDPFQTVKNGDVVRVDGEKGTLEIVSRKE
jgi:predicted aconitase with swiveling domain